VASITSMSFDAAAYSPGDLMTLTIQYVADTPSVNPVNGNATADITDSAGTVTATDAAPFVVNQPVDGGDTVSVSDDGGRTWTEVSDSGSVAVFSATA
jgi:hypothetical protein